MDLSNLRIMNAAGHCKDIREVRALARSPVTEITIGSFTKEHRFGNSGSVFWQSPDQVYALNSLGLPNKGRAGLALDLPFIQNTVREHGKRLRISIAGFDPGEYESFANAVSADADTIELNLGCPNVWGDGTQKPIASFNTRLMDDIFGRMHSIVKEKDVMIAVKVSPYSDPGLLGEVIDVCKEHRGFIREIVTCNTFPNAFGWDGDKAAVTPGNGFAGMSGKAMKGIALGQAMRFRHSLSWSDFSVIGVGGITTGQDIIDYARCGINGVQVGTHYFLHGAKVFSELLQEYAEFA